MRLVKHRSIGGRDADPEATLSLRAWAVTGGDSCTSVLPFLVTADDICCG